MPRLGNAERSSRAHTRVGDGGAELSKKTVRLPVRVIYRRIWCRGNLKYGGRWYSWLQRLPLAVRLRLLIDGHEVAEADYANLHPTILYAWADVPPPADCYRLYGDARDEIARPYVKGILMALLNTKELDKVSSTTTCEVT